MIKAFLFSINIPLYNTYENPVRFKSVTERNTFFKSYDTNFISELDNKWTSIKERNISYGNGLLMNLDLPLDTTCGYINAEDDYTPVLTRLEPNYLCVRYFDEVGRPVFEEDRFYFINNSQLLNKNVIRLQCELDVMSTYIYGVHYQINGKVFAERKHCSRITKSIGDKLIYLFQDISLDESFDNQLECDVITSTYEPLQKTEFTNLTNEYLKDKYFYLIVSTEPMWREEATVYVANGFTLYANNVNTGLYYYLIPAFDCYVSTNIKTDKSLIYGETNYKYWLDTYKDKGIVSVSLIPFNLIKGLQSSSHFEYVNNKFIISFVTPEAQHFQDSFTKFSNNCYIQYANQGISSTKLTNFAFNIYKIDKDLIEYEPLTIMHDVSNNVKSDINTLVEREVIDPKLFKEPYEKLQVVNINESYDYSLTKLNAYNVSLKTTVFPNVNNLQVYYKLEGNDTIDISIQNAYQKQKERGLGTYSNLLNNLNFINDKWKEYINNNKNWQELQTLNVVKSLMNLNPISTISSSLEYSLQNDNIKNRPNELKNIANNLYFDVLYYDYIGPKVYHYSISNQLREKISDYLFKFGYKVNQDISFSEFFNRQRFNYIKINDDIKCKVQALKIGNLPKNQMNANIIKKLNDILNTGTTLWNVCEEQFDTEYENWEVSLLG